MERHFQEQLDALKRQLLKMSALAELMLADALKVLVDRDRSRIVPIEQHEELVNGLQREIDETCLRLIALYQPAAGDLRFILGAVKTNNELERLADQAVNISQIAQQLLAEPPLKPFVIIPKMAALAGGMMKDSLHAFLNRDVARAEDVLVRDDQLDRLKTEVTVELIERMTKDPAAPRRAVDIILVARNLERIGDHATNIAENAIFVAMGRDIRHHAGD